MLTYTVPAGTDPNLLSQLLGAAGLQTSLILEGTTATLPELTDADIPAVQAVWATYQQRIADRDAVVNAMNANNTYLGLASPTTAQAVAQVRALTQQMNGLVAILNRRGILT